MASAISKILHLGAEITIRESDIRIGNQTSTNEFINENIKTEKTADSDVLSAEQLGRYENVYIESKEFEEKRADIEKTLKVHNLLFIGTLALGGISLFIFWFLLFSVGLSAIPLFFLLALPPAFVGGAFLVIKSACPIKINYDLDSDIVNLLLEKEMPYAHLVRSGTLSKSAPAPFKTSAPLISFKLRFQKLLFIPGMALLIKGDKVIPIKYEVVGTSKLTEAFLRVDPKKTTVGDARDFSAQEGSFLIAAISFFMPLVGLILYLVFKDKDPGKATSAANGALSLFCFALPLLGLGLSLAFDASGNHGLSKTAFRASITSFALIVGTIILAIGAFILMLIVSIFTTI